jgi:hypothetical protein
MILFLGYAAAAYTPDPTGVPMDFVCAYREYAAEYAARLRPDFDQSIVFDALMLGSLCNKTLSDIVRPDAGETVVEEQPGSTKIGDTVYVAVNGDDTNPGTEAKPMKTVGAGLLASRKLTGPKILMVGPGTYYLTSTLMLTEKDENLLITSTGQVWLSGAKPLPTLKWEKYKMSPPLPTSLSSHNNTNNQPGCKPNESSDPQGCQCYGPSSYGATLDKCFGFCKSLGADGCQSYAWSPGHQCCIRRTDTTWNPITPGHKGSCRGFFSGRWEGGRPAQNIWKATLPVDADTSIPQLRVNGGRSPRARHPNANMETDQWPIGYVCDAVAPSQWLPAKPVGKPEFVSVFNAELAERGQVSPLNYTGGIGGPCAVFDPPFSYWCSAHPRGGGGFQYFVPSGLIWPNGALPLNGSSGSTGSNKGGGSIVGGSTEHNTKAATTGAVAHVWRRSHWANWMFEVDDIDAASSTLKFGKGGFQGCRGGEGSDWYVENVLELLDTANEHYYDADSRTLYYQPNATTGPPPTTFSASAPQLQTLLLVNQTQGNPLKGLTIKGIGFRDTAPTYFEPHAVPSGGVGYTH